MNEQDNAYQKKILTIPNLLSLFRLCLIPLIVWLYCVKESYAWAIAFLLLSGLTDIVDGFVARRFHMVSDFGKAFDPVADKLTQLAMLICLITHFPAMLVPVIVLTVKEVVAAILGIIVIKKTGQVTGAVWHGKANTVLLYTTIVIHLAWYRIPALLSNTLIGLCTMMMLVSAVLYTHRNIQLLKKAR